RAIADLAASLGATTVIGLDVATDPSAPLEVGGRVPVLAGVPETDKDNGQGFRIVGGTDGRLYVASPQLLAYLGIDPTGFDPRADLLATEPDSDVVFISDVKGPTRGVSSVVTAPMPQPVYSSLPGALLTQASVTR